MTRRDVSLAKPRDPRDPQSLRRCLSVLDFPYVSRRPQPQTTRIVIPEALHPTVSNTAHVERVIAATSRREAGGKHIRSQVDDRVPFVVVVRRAVTSAKVGCDVRRTDRPIIIISRTAVQSSTAQSDPPTPPTVSTPVSPLRGTEKATRRPSPHRVPDVRNRSRVEPELSV